MKVSRSVIDKHTCNYCKSMHNIKLVPTDSWNGLPPYRQCEHVKSNDEIKCRCSIEEVSYDQNGDLIGKSMGEPSFSSDKLFAIKSRREVEKE